MVLAVKVIPRSSRNLVKEENGRLKVYLTRVPLEGLANAQLIAVLSEHFKLKKYQIRIIQGEKSRNKVIEIDG